MSSSASSPRPGEDLDGAATPATPTRTASTRSQPALSVSELRAALQQELRHNGVLKDLKTQLRGSVLTELMKKQKAVALSPAHRHRAEPEAAADDGDLEAFEAARRRGDGHPRRSATAAAAAPSSAPAMASWASRVSDALVENHLRRTSRAMSLSIFSTEAEVAPLSAMGAPSEEEQYLKRLLRCGDGGVSGERDGVESALGGTRGSAQSLLQQLVEARLLMSNVALDGEAARHRHSCSTQTDDTTQSEATNPLTSMECRLAAVDAKYALTFSQLRQNGAEQNSTFFTRSEVERRLQQYRHDIHAQLASEFQAKYKAFEQGKLQEAKAEQAARYENLVQIRTEEWRENERSLVVKVEQERQRLALAREDVERQKLALERRQREAGELVQDHEVAYNDLQAQLRELKEKCRLLHLQSSKWEELCGSRLVELEAAKSREIRRVEDMRRMQAEFSAELRLKEEDVARLRFRVRTLINQQGPPPTASTTMGGAGDATARDDAAAMTGASRMQNDLYNVLVRTEELQRNAVRQQQQSWEQAWNAREAYPAPPVQQTGSTATGIAAEAGTAPPPHAHPASSPASVAIPAASASAVVPTAGSHASGSPAPVSPIAAATTRLSSHSGSRDEREALHSSSAVPAAATAVSAAPVPVPVAARTVTSSTSSASAPRLASGQSSHDGSQPRPSAEAVAAHTHPSSSSPSASPSASSTPSKPVDAADTVEARPASSLASSATSAHASGASSPASSAAHDHDNDDGDHAEEAEEAHTAWVEAVEAALTEEAAARQTVEDDEDSARGGIQWSENSQRDVLRSQEAERAQQDGSGGGPRTLGFIDQMEQQRAQEALQRDNVIYRDDDDEDDSILFGGKSDGTDESF